MLVFYKVIDGETFYFCGMDSNLMPILSVDIDDSMHFNMCLYEFLLNMYELGFQPMWGK